MSEVILGAVCARGGSKGVPRKNMRLVAGKPLIAHTIECALSCSMLDEVIVSTDDPQIAHTAAAYGAAVPFLRPAELAEDSSSKWEVFRHLVTMWEQLDGRRVKVLVDLDTGVPMRQRADVEACVQLLLDTDAEVVTTAYEAERNPYFNMVENGADGLVHLVKPLGRPIACRQHAPRVLSLSPAVFAIRPSALWKHAHWSLARMKVHVVPRDRSLDIDSELDLKLVKLYMSSAGTRSTDPPALAMG